MDWKILRCEQANQLRGFLGYKRPFQMHLSYVLLSSAVAPVFHSITAAPFPRMYPLIFPFTISDQALPVAWCPSLLTTIPPSSSGPHLQCSASRKPFLTARPARTTKEIVVHLTHNFPFWASALFPLTDDKSSEDTICFPVVTLSK
jgi:hypothetical protein